MKKLAIVAMLVLAASRTQAADRVKLADYTSYATAAVNPSLAVLGALRSDHKACGLLQVSVAEGITNAAVLVLKHYVNSPRPDGSSADGFPSGHTANSAVGIGRGWKLGATFTVSTAALRVGANRHTKTQVSAGALIGVGADWASRQLVKCE